MTEDEYINATNLAKLRVMIYVLRSLSPTTEIESASVSLVAKELVEWECALENVVITK